MTTMQILKRLALASLLALATANLADAAEFGELSPEEQRALAAVAEEWPTLSDDARETLLKGARRWLALTPDERLRVEQRFGQWQSLPPEERRAIRERYTAFRELAPAQQRAVRSLFQRFKGLPPAQRRALRERFESMSPEERRAFVEGAGIGRRLGESARPNPRQPPFMTRARIIARDLSPGARTALRERFMSLDRAGRETMLGELERMSLEDRERYLTNPGE